MEHTENTRDLKKAGQARPAQERVSDLYQTASAASVGLELVLGTLVGFFFGDWLDDKAGTKPFLTILFLILGIAAGFKGVLRLAKHASREITDDKPATDPVPPTKREFEASNSCGRDHDSEHHDG